MVKYKKIWKIYLFLILVVVYFFYVFRNEITSDQASFFLEARDIARGNIFLVGWNLSTVSFYFTELAPFAIAIKIFGETKILIWLVPAIYYSAVIILSFSLAEKNKYGKLVIMTMIIPCSFAVFTTINACTHIGSLIIALFTVNCMRNKYGVFTVVLLPLINGLAIFSDELYLYFMTIPLLISLIAYPLIENEKINYRLVSMTLASLIIAVFMKELFTKIPHFYMMEYQKPLFVAFNNLWKNIYSFVYGLVNLFGSNFFSREIKDFEAIKSLVRLICIVSVIFFGLRFQSNTTNKNIIDRFLITSVVVSVAVFILSNMPVNEYSVRYLLPAIFMLIIYIARNVEIKRKSLILVLIPSIVMFSINFSDWKTQYTDTKYVKVAKYIDSEELGPGFASFWHSTSVAINSKEDISIAPIIFANGEAKPYRWLSKNSWYDVRSRYYIPASDEEVKEVTNIFGSDYIIKVISGIRIIIYPDKRIKVM